MSRASLALRRYANFSGRARRLEYWTGVLLFVVVAVILSVFDAALDLTWEGRAGGMLTSIFIVFSAIPLVGVAVRRLHDTDRNGWWTVLPMAALFLAMITIEADAAFASLLFFGVGLVGSIIALVFYCLPGTKGPNRYGRDPKYSPDIE